MSTDIMFLTDRPPRQPARPGRQVKLARGRDVECATLDADIGVLLLILILFSRTVPHRRFGDVGFVDPGIDFSSECSLGPNEASLWKTCKNDSWTSSNVNLQNL